MAKKFKTMDGNCAAAHCAYAFTEVAAIYPKENGLQGLMYWEYGNDFEGQIVGAMNQSLK